MNISNVLIQIGFFIFILGLIFKFLPENLTILPGDIFYKKEGFTFYFPFTTSIIISLLLTLIINLFK